MTIVCSMSVVELNEGYLPHRPEVCNQEGNQSDVSFDLFTELFGPHFWSDFGILQNVRTISTISNFVLFSTLIWKTLELRQLISTFTIFKEILDSFSLQFHYMKGAWEHLHDVTNSWKLLMNFYNELHLHQDVLEKDQPNWFIYLYIHFIDQLSATQFCYDWNMSETLCYLLLTIFTYCSHSALMSIFEKNFSIFGGGWCVCCW